MKNPLTKIINPFILIFNTNNSRERKWLGPGLRLWERERERALTVDYQLDNNNKAVVCLLLLFLSITRNKKKTEREIKGLIFSLSFFANGDSDGKLKCHTEAWSGRIGSGPVDHW